MGGRLSSTRRGLGLVICGSALVLAFAPAAARAATFPAACSGTTGNTADLINAINVANVNVGADTVQLGAGCRYEVGLPHNDWYGPNGLPAISSDLTIEGNGGSIVRMTGNRFRLFFVGANSASPATPGYVTPGAGRLVLRDLTLAAGLAHGGNADGGGGGAGMGGAIFNQGTTVIERVTFTGNTAEGGAANVTSAGFGGGGIGSSSNPDGNQHGGGFGGMTTFTNPGTGGAGGITSGGGGGAGFQVSANGAAGTVDGSNNRLGGDGGGPQTGLGGRGGSSNGASGFPGDGSGGGAGSPPSGGNAGAGGGFGIGGRAGTSLIAFGGGGGVGGGGGGGGGTNSGSGGGGGFGGGGGTTGSGGVTITGYGGDGGFGGGGAGFCAGCSGGNPGFGGGAGVAGAGGGGAGMGGAIFNMQGTVEIRNSTFTGNSATGGVGGASNPGQGLGGAVFNLSGAVTADGSTFADNTAAEGGASIYNMAYDRLNDRQGLTTLRNTIVAGAGPALLVSDWPIFTASGFNSGSATADVSSFDLVRTMEARGIGAINGTPMTADPQLGPLGANGGPTPTMAPAEGSPVVDAGSAVGLATDQRGLARPSDFAAVANAGDGADIGAVELQVPAPPGAGAVTAAVVVTAAVLGTAVAVGIHRARSGPKR